MSLRIERIEVSYGRAPAVRDVSIVLEPGEIVAVVGANGAGKSTTLLAAAGILHPRAGDIAVEGQSLLSATPEQRVERRLALVPEGREIFRDLTVGENLLIARSRRRASGSARRQDELLELFPILRHRYGQFASRLSGGEQQQLAIARALMGEPRYLMIDEPSLGLAPMMTAKVYDLLVEMRRREGLGILVVEQNMRRVLGAADRLYVIREGVTAGEFARKDLTDLSLIENAYFGTPREAI
jgi:branched-chain amino acid transport system ATP-binding protein